MVCLIQPVDRQIHVCHNIQLRREATIADAATTAVAAVDVVVVVIVIHSYCFECFVYNGPSPCMYLQRKHSHNTKLHRELRPTSTLLYTYTVYEIYSRYIWIYIWIQQYDLYYIRGVGDVRVTLVNTRGKQTVPK